MEWWLRIIEPGDAWRIMFLAIASYAYFRLIKWIFDRFEERRR